MRISKMKSLLTKLRHERNPFPGPLAAAVAGKLNVKIWPTPHYP
jgi:hypothetical protein